MNTRKNEFIQKMGIAFERNGTAPMLGRVWGALLVCETGEMTAEHLATELHVSRGAISHATRQLSAMQYIEKFHKAGDRKDHFRIVSHGLVQASRQRMVELRRMQELLRDGVAAMDDNPNAARHHLEEHLAFTHAMEIAMERFLDEWQQQWEDKRAERNSNV